jgi:hypothetical protein
MGWKSKVVVAGILFLGAGFVSLPYITIDEVTVQVTGKERIQDTGYLVFTKEETFKNTDTIAFLKFNSSDVYGRIPVGSTCQLTVNGWRVPFLSLYRNIIKVECPNV